MHGDDICTTVCITERDSERLALLPNYVSTTEQLGQAMIAVARNGYTKPILEPASLVINTAVTQVLYDMRRYDDAEKSGHAVLQLDPAFQLGLIDLAKVLIERGKANEALNMVRPTLDVPGVSRFEKIGVVAYAMARAGRVAEARSILDSAESSAAGVTPRGMVAAAYDAIGARDKAVTIMRAAVENHDLWLAHYFSAAPYDGLRKDPRVEDLFKKISSR